MTRPEDPARQEDPTLTYLTHSAAYGRPGQGDGVLLGLFRLLGRGIRALVSRARRQPVPTVPNRLTCTAVKRTYERARRPTHEVHEVPVPA